MLNSHIGTKSDSEITNSVNHGVRVKADSYLLASVAIVFLQELAIVISLSRANLFTTSLALTQSIGVLIRRCGLISI